MTPNKLSASAVVMLALSLAGSWILTLRIRNVQPAQRGDYVARLTGMTLDSRWVADDEHHCHVVRYESKQCKFCREEAPLWNALAAKAKAAGCGIVTIVPYHGTDPSDDAATKGQVIVFPSLAFVQSTRLQMTPSTIICTEKWQIAWIKKGAMSSADLAAAGNELGKLGQLARASN